VSAVRSRRRRGGFTIAEGTEQAEDEWKCDYDPTNGLGASPPVRYDESPRNCHRRGMPVNTRGGTKKRIMREDKPAGDASRSNSWSPPSHHKLEIYLNLAGRYEADGINQLWVGDIKTYIRAES